MDDRDDLIDAPAIAFVMDVSNSVASVNAEHDDMDNAPSETGRLATLMLH